MAAGLGTRMKSATPKHLHPLLGRRLVDWVVEAVRPLGADPLVVVLSPEAAGAVKGVSVAVQEKPLGTGDSLRAARETVGAASGASALGYAPQVGSLSAPGVREEIRKSEERKEDDRDDRHELEDEREDHDEDRKRL